jgi:hypothetical protein
MKNYCLLLHGLTNAKAIDSGFSISVLGPEFSIQRGILALFDLVMLHGVLLA